MSQQADQKTINASNSDDEKVINGGALTTTAGIAEKVIYSAQDTPKYDPTRGIKRTAGIAIAITLGKDALDAVSRGDMDGASEKSLMALGVAAQNSKYALEKLAGVLENTKIGAWTISNVSNMVSTMPRAASPVISLGLNSIAAAEEENPDRAKATLLVGFCKTIGYFAGGTIGSVFSPVAGTAVGAYVGGELSAEDCANIYAEHSDSHTKVVGSTWASLANVSEAGSALSIVYDEAKKMVQNGVLMQFEEVQPPVTPRSKDFIARGMQNFFADR